MKKGKKINLDKVITIKSVASPQQRFSPLSANYLIGSAAEGLTCYSRFLPH